MKLNRNFSLKNLEQLLWVIKTIEPDPDPYGLLFKGLYLGSDPYIKQCSASGFERILTFLHDSDPDLNNWF